MRKRILALALSFCMALGLMPQAALAAGHVHDDTCGYAAPVPCGHTTHDDTCGYVAAVDGQTCKHEDNEHDASCGYAEGKLCPIVNCDHSNCGYVEEKPCSRENCDHSDCGYVEGAQCQSADPNCDHTACGFVDYCPNFGCDHQAEDNCGYVEGTPCPNADKTCDHNTCGYAAPVPCGHTTHDDTCGYVLAVEGLPCKHEDNEHDDTCGYSQGSACNYVPPSSSDDDDDDNDYDDIFIDTEWDEAGEALTLVLGLETAGGSTAHGTLSRAEAATLIYRAVQEDADQIVLDYSDKVVGDVSSAEISIPASVVERFVERTDADLRLVTPIADASLDPDTLARYMGELSMKTRRTDDTIAATVTIGSETVIDAGVELPEGVEMTDDMKLIVSTEKATLAPIASTMMEKASLGDLQCPEEYDTLTYKDTVEIYGSKCKLYETLVLGGVDYILWGSSQDGPVLLRLLDGRGMVYTGGSWLADYPDSSFDRTVEKPTNTTVTIDGVTYDVGYIVNNSTYILYRDGQLAGMYPSTDNAADLHGSVQFYEGYDPETLKAQQDDNDLGSVTIPADYDNAALADLAPGKTYKVSVVAANDISVEGYDDALLNSITEDTPEIAAAKAEVERLKADMDAKWWALIQMDINDPNYTDAEIAYNEASQAYASAYVSLADLTNLQGATVSQTFKVPDALIGAKNVKYVGVHDTNPFADDLAYWEHEMKRSPGDEHIQRLYEDAKARYDAWEEENGSGAEFGVYNPPSVYIVDANGRLVKNDEFVNRTFTYYVKDLSPFIVYAFVEQPEPEYKVITTNTEPAGGEDDVPASPATGDDTPAAPAYTTYTVQSGDTLWAIARKYGCTVSEIVALNGELIKDPDLILVGWELLIPQD